MTQYENVIKELPEWAQTAIKEMYQEVCAPNTCLELSYEEALTKGLTEDEADDISGHMTMILEDLYEGQDIEQLMKVAEMLGYSK